MTADTVELPLYLVYFSSTLRSAISARCAIFTPACAANFTFYRTKTRHLEYIPSANVLVIWMLRVPFCSEKRARKRHFYAVFARSFKYMTYRIVSQLASFKEIDFVTTNFYNFKYFIYISFILVIFSVIFSLTWALRQTDMAIADQSGSRPSELRLYWQVFYWSILNKFLILIYLNY